MLLDAAERTPEAVALVDAETGTAWSYGRLAETATKIAARLSGGHKGVVAWISRAVPESIAGYLGALQTEHATLPLPANLSDSLMTGIVTAYQPDLMLALPDDHLPPAIVAAYTAEHTDQSMVVWRRRAESGGLVHRDLCLLLSTSGSTGSPKLVRLTYGNLSSNAEGIAEALGIGPDECAVTSLPLFYSYGLSVLHSHLLVGARLLVTERSLVEAPFWSALERYACTSLAGVPYMYGILGRVGLENRAPPSLRTLTQAGGKMANDLIERYGTFMAGRGGQLYVMYGQTEATARITILPPALLPDKLGGVGFPLRGGRLEIRDAGPAGGPSAPSGEIVYTGPNVMLGYAEHREDLARGDDLHGVLETGDLGYLDADGCLFVTGRRKRMAKVFGLRVSLDELESRLTSAGPVAVTGRDDAIAVYTVPTSVDAMREALTALALEVHLHSSAFRLRTVPDVPLLPNGKVDYASLPD